MQGAELTANIVLIPILRAGMALLSPFLSLFPRAAVGFFGIRRDEATAKPIEYYENIPLFSSHDNLIILDPMIATGGSAHLAVKKLSSKGAALSRFSSSASSGPPRGSPSSTAITPASPSRLPALTKSLTPTSSSSPALAISATDTLG